MGSRRFRSVMVLLGAALVVLVLAGCAQAATRHNYQQVLGQPCNACHTQGGVSSDLSARGQAFAAVADYKANPQAAWASAVRQYPLPPSSGAGASILVPIAVVALLAVWLYTMLRRRRAPTSQGSRL